MYAYFGAYLSSVGTQHGNLHPVSVAKTARVTYARQNSPKDKYVSVPLFMTRPGVCLKSKTKNEVDCNRKAETAKAEVLAAGKAYKTIF